MSEGRYSRIKSRFWTDEKAAGWDDATKLLAIYLLSSPHLNILGCYVLPLGYICEDLGWTAKRLSKPFAKLLLEGFIEYDENTRLLLVKNYLKHNPIENPNQAQAASSMIKELPESPILVELKRLLEPFGERFKQPLDELFAERFGKPVSVTVSVTESVTETEEKHMSSSSLPNEYKNKNEKDAAERSSSGIRSLTDNTFSYPEEFENFWKDYPRHQYKQRAFRVWQARKKEGLASETMVAAARNYAASVRQKKVDEQYVCLASTFLGDDRIFEEWLRPSRCAVPAPPEKTMLTSEEAAKCLARIKERWRGKIIPIAEVGE